MSKLIDTVTRERIECNCADSGHNLHISFEVTEWDDLDWIELSISAHHLPFVERLRRAWSALTGHDYWLHNVSLELDGARRLASLLLDYVERKETKDALAG